RRGPVAAGGQDSPQAAGGSEIATAVPLTETTSAAQPGTPSSNVFSIALLAILGVATAGSVYVLTVREDRKRRAKYNRLAAAADKSNSTESPRSRSRR
ncbi:MAG: hypothetical protein KF861_18675, partial [Planctomycetaceae bacterium]|nr:hypothetical protein [Planctomycetaceae bacterium]